MATATDYQRLRADVGASVDALGDIEAGEIFDEAGESYGATGTIKAETRVIAVQRIMASAAKLTTYRQNNTQENLSDVMKNLKVLLDYWTDQRDAAYAIETRTASRGAARFGGKRITPTRVKEYPDA